MDPLSLHMNAAVAMIHHLAGRSAEAIEYGRRTIELDANFFPGYFYLGLAYHAQGQHAEAVTALQQATALSGNSTLMLAALAGAFAFWGKEEETRKILHELEELARQKYVSQTWVAVVYAGLGETDRALTCLEHAYDDRCTWLIRSIANDARLDRLRHEAQFHDLARRVGISPSR
jgi:tetratricopeptide (TPR) repeat protein